MASKYGYITVLELEQYASEHYSDIDDVQLNDTNIEAKISAAEELINTYVGSSFSGTIPDGISYATKNISKRIILGWMRENGMLLDKEKILESQKPLLDDDLKGILDIYKAQSVSPIRLHRLYNNDPRVYP